MNNTSNTVKDSVGNTWYRVEPVNLPAGFNQQYEATFLGTSYCLFLGDGTCKIGYSTSPADRLEAEVRDALGCPGKDVMAALVLPPHTNYKETRLALLQAFPESSIGGNLFSMKEDVFLKNTPPLPLLDKQKKLKKDAQSFMTMMKNIVLVGVENIAPGTNLAKPLFPQNESGQRENAEGFNNPQPIAHSPGSTSVKEHIAMRQEIISIKPTSIGGQAVNTVNGRDLHVFLDVGKDFSTWIKVQIERGRLVEGRDFVKLTQKGELSPGVFPQKGENPQSGRPAIEYHLALDAAKHIAMMSGTEKGFEVRDYFIECERAALGHQHPEPTPTLTAKKAQDISRQYRLANEIIKRQVAIGKLLSGPGTAKQKAAAVAEALRLTGVNFSSLLPPAALDSTMAGAFAAEVCVVHPVCWVSKHDLFEAYIAWCGREKHRPVSKGQFYVQILRRFPVLEQRKRLDNHSDRAGSRLNVFVGIGLQSDFQTTQEETV